MAQKADLSFSEFLNKNGILPPDTLEAELAVVDEIAALGLRVNLARVLRERGVLDEAAIGRVLALPMKESKRTLLAEQLRWLKAPPPSEPKVAELALQCGILSAADLEEAKALQEKVRPLRVDKRPLEVLIEKGKLLPEVAVALFDALREPQQAVFSRADLTFCTVASIERAVTPADLQAAIALQRRLCARTRVGRPLGEILFATGKLPAEALATITEVVRGQCPDEPPHRVNPANTSRDQDRKIAELVQRGWIELDQVEESRRVQEVMKELGIGRKLGEVLIARGVVALDRLDALYQSAKDGPPPVPADEPEVVQPLESLLSHPAQASPTPAPAGPTEMAPLEDDATPMEPLADDEAIAMEPLADDEDAPIAMEPLPDDAVLRPDPPRGIIHGRPGARGKSRKPAVRVGRRRKKKA